VTRKLEDLLCCFTFPQPYCKEGGRDGQYTRGVKGRCGWESNGREALGADVETTRATEEKEREGVDSGGYLT
jgi:hypothetical protein